MTTTSGSERKARANRANAQASTGPRTAAGKARSRHNARKHGLTTPPDAVQVARMARLLTADCPPGLAPSERAARDQAAWALAQAEVQVARVGHHIALVIDRLFERACRPPRPERAFQNLQRQVQFMPLAFDAMAVGFIRKFMADFAREYRDLADQLRRLDRYLREAEARRRKALHRWIAVWQGPDSRNEARYNLDASLPKGR